MSHVSSPGGNYEFTLRGRRLVSAPSAGAHTVNVREFTQSGGGGAFGNIVASLFLWAGKRNLMTPFRFVVDNGGVTGCCRMIWKGKHVGPTE